MRAAILVPPKDFKDESVSNLRTMLGKWGIECVLTSYSTSELVGYHGAVYNVELNSAKISPDEFDVLILVDGKGVDEYRLYDFRQLLDLVKLFSMRKKLVAGIGNSLKIIARANIISGVKIAPVKDEDTRRLVALYHGIESKEDPEFDKGILTLGSNDKILVFIDILLRRLGAK